NSQGLRLPKDIIKDLHLAIGDMVNIIVENNRVIIEPIKKEKHIYDINELVSQIPSSYEASEEITSYTGKEEW
ncbi:MAG: AbrB/MazE/SpoVT family DNA-binding domain-containing protein, partial [Campylobacterota bacterium]|nr:AbrB/MazE/SpoVT family DNA-binding domain-containing protein [Campylobacterota bacterium]